MFIGSKLDDYTPECNFKDEEIEDGMKVAKTYYRRILIKFSILFLWKVYDVEEMHLRISNKSFEC